MTNRQTIEDYYRQHYTELLTFLSSRIGDAAEAEDMVQEVFLRLLSLRQPIMETALPALTYTIARRMLIDYYRRRAFRQEMMVTTLNDPLSSLNSQPSTLNSPASLLSVREITEQMERSLARLPEGCGRVYRLHIYGGMSVGKIAQELHENYKSVEYRLGIARKEIRKHLKQIV